MQVTAANVVSEKVSETRKRYRQPHGAVAASLWRMYIWFGSMIGLTVMEPWEETLVLLMFGMIFTLIAFGFVNVFPQFVVTALGRTRYYLMGSETTGA